MIVLKKIIILSLLLVFLLSINTTNGYQFISIFHNDTTLNRTTQAPSFYSPQACNVSFSNFATTTAAGSLENKWYSPDNVLRASSSPTYTGAVTCRFQGNASTQNDLNNYYEAQTTTIPDVNTRTWIEAYYNCVPDANDITTYSNTNFVDSYGFYPYLYVRQVFGYCSIGVPGSIPSVIDQVQNVINYLDNGYYTDCGSQLYKGTSNQLSSSCALNRLHGLTWWSTTLFNSGSFGQVNISVTSQDTIQTDAGYAAMTCVTNKTYLWRPDTNSTIFLSNNPVPYSDELFLNPETDYWLLIGTHCTGATSAVGTSTLGYNSSIFEINVNAYEPDYSCGAWSTCEDSLQQRTCIDLNGISPDRIENRICDLTIIENATLGFEDGEDTTVTICRPDWNVITSSFGVLGLWQCGHTPVNISIERPSGWSVSGDSLFFNRYFMKMSNKWSTEGSQSLEIWTIPMKEHETYWDGAAVTCTNTTDTEFPIIERNVSNTSLSVGFNVTFPSTNMRLRFDAKRCDRQVQQHGSQFSLWNITQICPQVCYSSNCSTQPDGQFFWNIQNASSSLSMIGGNDHVVLTSSKTQTVELDLSGLGLVVGENYTISFAVFQDDYFSTQGNCVMLDNVRYDVLEETYLTILGGECESKCVGNDYYQANILDNGNCLVRKETFSPICLTGDIADQVNLLQDVCIDSNNLLHYNERMANYEEILCDFGCADGHCQTITENETIEDESSRLQPLQSAQAWIDWILFLVSPIFIYFFISIAISGAVGALTKKWQPFGITFGFLMFVGMLIEVPGGGAPIIPIWVGLAIIVVISLLMAKTLREFAFSGGGG